jgi:hypothetical protein
MKKLTENDIYIYTIKTYPKVTIFIYSGSMYYNNNTVSSSGVELFDFLTEQKDGA